MYTPNILSNNFANETFQPGFIFLCNGRTKPECYHYRVFGLPAEQIDSIKKVGPGSKLFLFDFESKLLYGTYEATCRGGLDLEPTAFRGKFQAQVQFKILLDCVPISESSFRPAIQENYRTGTSKFRQELSAEQVKSLLALFCPIPMPQSILATSPSLPLQSGYGAYALEQGTPVAGSYNEFRDTHTDCSFSSFFPRQQIYDSLLVAPDERSRVLYDMKQQLSYSSEMRGKKRIIKDHERIGTSTENLALPSPISFDASSYLATSIQTPNVASNDCKDEMFEAGFIFLCNGATKLGCYRQRVFGLPADKIATVRKIGPGSKLFLFDFELKFLYGIYEATCTGGLDLEPAAFSGKFPAQVKFKILMDCSPLSERVFRHAIQENYQNGTSKFRQELNDEQVEKLLALFQPIPESKSIYEASPYHRTSTFS